MCAASDERISTLKCPDCSLSFSYLLSGAKKSFKVAFTPPPPLFFGSIFSLSLSLSLLPSTSFLSLSAKASAQKTHPIIKTNIYRAGPVFIHQNNMVIFLLLFFFFFVNESE